VYVSVIGGATREAGIAVFAGRRSLIIIVFRSSIYFASHSVKGHFRLILPKLATINLAY
jgi:hypothetical protein